MAFSCDNSLKVSVIYCKVLYRHELREGDFFMAQMSGKGLLTGGSPVQAGAQVTPETTPTAPPKATVGRQFSRNLPKDSLNTYSILETGEVVAVAVEPRSTSGDIWLWSDEEKQWYIPEEQTVGQLREGLDRYEQILGKDPKRAAELRQRADNTIDGRPNPEPGQQAPKATGNQTQGVEPSMDDQDGDAQISEKPIKEREAEPNLLTSTKRGAKSYGEIRS